MNLKGIYGKFIFVFFFSGMSAHLLDKANVLAGPLETEKPPKNKSS
jgi:hypothetical protein